MNDSNRMRLTAKQERFAQLLFQGHTQYDAYMQTYSPTNNRNVADVNAHRVATSAKIKLRLAELRNCVTTQNVATVTERKERLTTFIREDIVSKAGRPTRITNIASIQELNKMDHVYEEAPAIDARQFIYITSEKAKEMLGKVADRRKALPGGVTSIEEADDAG